MVEFFTLTSLGHRRLVALVRKWRPLVAGVVVSGVAVVGVGSLLVAILLLRVGAVVELRVGVRVGGRQRDRRVLVGQGVLLHVALLKERWNFIRPKFVAVFLLRS